MTADADRPADAAQDPRALTRATSTTSYRRRPGGRQRHVRPPRQRRLLRAVRLRDQRLADHRRRRRRHGATQLGVVAESGCRYFRELEYPRPSTSASASNGSDAAASPTRWDSSTPRRTSSPRSATGCTSTSTASPAPRCRSPLRYASCSGAPNGPGREVHWSAPAGRQPGCRQLAPTGPCREPPPRAAAPEVSGVTGASRQLGPGTIAPRCGS